MCTQEHRETVGEKPRCSCAVMSEHFGVLSRLCVFACVCVSRGVDCDLMGQFVVHCCCDSRSVVMPQGRQC